MLEWRMLHIFGGFYIGNKKTLGMFGMFGIVQKKATGMEPVAWSFGDGWQGLEDRVGVCVESPADFLEDIDMLA